MSRFADLRIAIRNIVQRPLAAGVVVGTLALALAFNVAAASVLTALLERPFSYPDLDQLVLVRDGSPREGVHQGRAIAAADLLDIRRSVGSFASLTAWRPTPLVITSAGADPESIDAAAVSANFFSTLGVAPIAGSLWPGDADQPGRDGVVVLSRRLWRSRFGGDMSAVGREVFINGRRVTIAGIIRDADCYPAGVDAWLPLVLTPADGAERGAQRLNAIARLAPNASLTLAREQVAATAAQLAASFPTTNEGRAFDLLPLRREQYEFTAPLFGFVQAAALLVLILAVVNVTNVLVARTLDRRRELAIRSMLGASQRRVAGLVAGEAALLTLAATTLGVVLAVPALATIRASLPEGISRWVNGWSGMHMDPVALALSAALGVATAIVIGGVTALSARGASAAESSGSRLTQRRTWGRRIVTASEVALAAALLLCASVIVRGFALIATSFDGLTPTHVLKFSLNSPPWRYPDDVRVSAFHKRLIDDLQALPGVQAAALVRNEPASNVPNPTVTFERQDATRRVPAAELPRADTQVVSIAAFDVLRVALVSGRTFLTTDTADATRVAIVSRETVRRFWPDRDPIGTSVQLSGVPAPVRIVGVVSDLRLNWYDPAVSPVIYLPDAQSPARNTAVLLRTAVEAWIHHSRSASSSRCRQPLTIRSRRFASSNGCCSLAQRSRRSSRPSASTGSLPRWSAAVAGSSASATRLVRPRDRSPESSCAMQPPQLRSVSPPVWH
jgi:predicted permease